jgi:hypothetical protein
MATESKVTQLSGFRNSGATVALTSSETSCLLLIWMAVAPIPISGLLSLALSVVRAIILVPFYQVSSVGVVFAVVPIVVVVMVRVVNSDRSFLWCCSGYGRSACRKGCC